MIKAVIFDMDGVIIDSEAVYLEKIWKFGVKKNPDLQLEQLYPMVGASREDCWTVCSRAIGYGDDWERVRKEFSEEDSRTGGIDYRAIFRTEIPGILQQLQDRGYKLAVASSTELALVKRVMEENGIIDYFEVLVSGEQFTRSKPDPEIYQYTAGKLGVTPSECLAVEDSTFGVTAGHRAGMKVAALKDERFRFDQSLADYHMDSLNEIIEILKGLEA